MKKASILFFTFINIVLISHAQQPKFQWVKSMGGDSSSIAANSMAIDSSGNIITIGTFGGTVDFDPGPGTYKLSSSTRRLFISKLDAFGNFLWAKSISGGSELNLSIAADSTDNIYIIGSFSGTVDFDPDTTIFNMTSTGQISIYILKLDPLGNFRWVKQMRRTSYDYAYDYGQSIATDAFGNVYTTGQFTGTVDFNPGTDTCYLTTMGGFDTFISKLDSSGNFVWVKQIEGIYDNPGFGITVDKLGYIYITGNFIGPVDFDPGKGKYTLTSTGKGNMYITKLDPSGGFVWAKKMGGTDYCSGEETTVDASGNVYITGWFSGTADFDPGVGVFNLTAQGSADATITKLNSAGDFLWAKSIGGSAYDYGQSIAVDALGNVFTIGMFSRTIDIDPGDSVVYLTTSENDNMFIVELDSLGRYVWGSQLGGGGSDRGYSVKLDAAGGIYTTGYFTGTTDFDPGSGDFSLTAVGGLNLFIQKLSHPTTGINEYTHKTSSAVYPNPVHNTFTVVFSNQTSKTSIKLLTILGQIVAEQTDITGTSYTIDMSNQPDGVYYLLVNENGILSSTKIVRISS